MYLEFSEVLKPTPYRLLQKSKSHVRFQKDTAIGVRLHGAKNTKRSLGSVLCVRSLN